MARYFVPLLWLVVCLSVFGQELTTPEEKAIKAVGDLGGNLTRP